MNAIELADLHRVRLGKALAPEATDPASQVKYRVFERGIVAVNWNPVNAGSFPGHSLAPTTVVTPQNQFFYDLFTPGNAPIDTSATAGLLQVPPQSGRVFLFGSSTDYGLNRLSVSSAAAVSVPQPSIQPPISPPTGPPQTTA